MILIGPRPGLLAASRARLPSHERSPVRGASGSSSSSRAASRCARGGKGGAWLIGGEPGIGKSRLLEELARASRAGVDVLWGRAWEAGGAPAYWPWIQVLRALLQSQDGAAALVVRRARAVAPLVRAAARAATKPAQPEPTARRRSRRASRCSMRSPRCCAPRRARGRG